MTYYSRRVQVVLMTSTQRSCASDGDDVIIQRPCALELVTSGVPAAHDDAAVLWVVSYGVHDLLQLVHALARVVCTHNHTARDDMSQHLHIDLTDRRH